MPHTPGPWEAKKSGIYGGSLCIARRHPQASVEWEANARLIAAAPELLAALGRAKDAMSAEGENDLEEWCAVLAQMEAAILKAGGEL